MCLSLFFGAIFSPPVHASQRKKFSAAYPCGDPCVGLRVYPVSSGACALDFRVSVCVALRGVAWLSVYMETSLYSLLLQIILTVTIWTIWLVYGSLKFVIIPSYLYLANQCPGLIISLCKFEFMIKVPISPMQKLIHRPEWWDYFPKQKPYCLVSRSTIFGPLWGHHALSCGMQ